jgi:hypothetical protein
MALWRWLVGALIVLGHFVAFFWLDRFCLWLEDRGWLYYRRKKPSSSAASAWVAIQQFIEPGVKHIVQIKQERRSEEDEEAGGERILANLLATLDALPINPEVVRFYLSVAQRAGLDWKGLYEEAVQIQRSRRSADEALIPSPEDVAPIE